MNYDNDLESIIYSHYMEAMRHNKFSLLYPDLTGNWEDDREEWYKEYFAQLELIKKQRKIEDEYFNNGE